MLNKKLEQIKKELNELMKQYEKKAEVIDSGIKTKISELDKKIAGIESSKACIAEAIYYLKREEK